MAKRTFDFAVSLVLIALFFSLLLVVALIVYWRIGKPILFVQLRPGKGGRVFKLIKFRTMTGRRDSEGELLPDSDRLNRFGRLLRASSLDELPELFNVLLGNMSLVGPRPLLIQYLDRYTPEQARRHEVRPGITGWAQVNGRNAISWDEKFKLDVWYVDNWSLLLDLRILVMTAWQVLHPSGISQEGQATMEEFMGSEIAEGEEEDE